MTREIIVESRIAPVTVLESAEGKTLRFEAVVSEADHLNRNRRVYPETVLFPAFERLNENIAQYGGVGGAVDHPGPFNPSAIPDIGIKWEGFRFEGKQVIGTGSVVPTTRGRDLAAVIEAGLPVGFSTRGFGESEEAEDTLRGKHRVMKAGFELETIDAVVDPSVFHARLRHYRRESIEEMNEELNAALEAKGAAEAKLTSSEARVAELEGTVAEKSSTVETLEARVTELTQANESLTARVGELEAELSESRQQAEENALTAKLNELVEGHRFAPTIIAEARELGVTLESAEKVVTRLKALVEAAGASANEDAGQPRGVVESDEDAAQQTAEGTELSDEDEAELRAAGLM